MSAPEDITGAPPAGEEVHMPAPSALPLINAAALAIAIVALTISWWVVGVALLMLVATTIRRVGDVKRDNAQLTLEHHH